MQLSSLDLSYNHKPRTLRHRESRKWLKIREEIILLCVRWYLCYPLRYRQLAEMMAQRGLSIEPSTLYGLLPHYSSKVYKKYKVPPIRKKMSWRIEQKRLKIQGEWKYVYLAIDSEGNTLDFLLSGKRDLQTAKLFFRKVFKPGDHQSLYVRDIANNGAYLKGFEQFKTKNLSKGANIHSINLFDKLGNQSHNLLHLVEGKVKLKACLGIISSLLFLGGSTYTFNFFESNIKADVNNTVNTINRDYPDDGTALTSLNPSEKAFLDTISWAEGTLTKYGYHTLFGGELIEDLSRHPNRCIPFRSKGKRLCSTAFGRYQILDIHAQDMSFAPQEQDKWAMKKLKEIGAIAHLKAGDIEKAIVSSCKTWSSLPCHYNDARGYYDQPTKSMTSLLSKYQERLQLYPQN